MQNNDSCNIITFGVHKGKLLSDPSIPKNYIFWLAFRGAYYKTGNQFDPTWKVPITLSILARREAERRGYKREGNRYINYE